MAKYNRLKCFLLMFILIQASSALPQDTFRSADNSTYEVSAKMCPFDEFECQDGSGNCIRRSWRCDGEEDCIDGSDEKDCFNNRQSDPECKFGSFMCLDGSDRCIHKSWRCDGEDDCSDGSDEKNCYSNKIIYARCPSGMFMCQDGSERCIRGSWRCNGEYDCMDGSDEKNCFTANMECPSGEFMCKDGSRRCIRDSWRCDGEDDCSNGSDEKNCYTTALDSAQHGLDIINDESQIYEDLRTLVERLSDQQDGDRKRFLFGCTTPIINRKYECLNRCTNLICKGTELTNFLGACFSGVRQTCTTLPAVTQSYTNCDMCGMVNTMRARRIGGKPIKGNTTRHSSETTNINEKLTRQSVAQPIRIVGGSEVTPGVKYPWMALITLRNNRICGGSIINSRWILTAARCIESGQKVRIGEHNRDNTNDNNPNFKIYDVMRSVKQPDGVDIALLELTEDITFNNDVNGIRPACLPTDDSKTYAGVSATVIGWGLTANGGSASNVLREVVVPIDARTKCRGPPPFTFISKVKDYQICAGPMGNKDRCQQDDGGPLMVQDGNKWTLVGTVEKAPKCGNANLQSATYIRISKFLNWIRTTTTNGMCT